MALSMALAGGTLHAQETQDAETAGVTLNLKEADISSLISTVAEVTGRNFIIDPRVKAKITVVSSKPMATDEIYDVFLSILQVHGFAAVDVGSVTKILPDVIAKQGPVIDDGTGDQLITRVIPVHNVSAVQLIPILRPLIPQQAHMAAYPQSNVLVVSDHAINIDRIVEIVRRIDQADESQEIEVIPLKHASAAEVVRVLNGLRAAGATGAPGSNLSAKTVLTADERTNSVLMTGDKADRLRMRGIIAHLDTPAGGTGSTHVVFLNYANAEELAPILQAVSTQQTLVGVNTEGGARTTATNGQTTTRAGSSGEPSDSEIGIEADPRNNALIITAPPEKYAGIKAVIDKLDVRRAQVLVEAIIAEVSDDLSRDLGVQFAALGEEDSRGIIGTNFGGAGNSIVQLVQDPFTVGQGLSVAVGRLGSSTNFGVLLRALAGDASTNILSTPSLVTLDNEEAEVIVAQNVPFITGSFTNTGSGGGSDTSVNPFQTIEREDVGVTLRITPQINEGDSIRLAIETESSSLAATPTGVNASDLITNTRSIKTNVLVEDGQLVILGGLIEDNRTDSVQKVPVLGDIPLLGHLFRFSSSNKAKQNLMTFIRPVILRDAATASAYTSEKYQYLRAQQLDAKIGDSPRLSQKSRSARLPDLDEMITEPPQIKP